MSKCKFVVFVGKEHFLCGNHGFLILPPILPPIKGSCQASLCWCADFCFSEIWGCVWHATCSSQLKTPLLCQSEVGEMWKKKKTTQPVTSCRLYVTALPGTEGKKIPMLSSCSLERAFPAPSARQKCKACCDLDLGSLLLFICEVSSRQGAGEEPEGKKAAGLQKSGG